MGSELGAALQKGELTPEEARELAYQWQQQGVDLSKLAAGLSAALVGGNVDVAANTAENAVENNALCGGACITGALAVIGALWTAYDVASVYQEEGGEAALKQLAVDGVITVAALGSGKVVYKVGKITYKSAAKAYQAAKEAGLLRGVARGAVDLDAPYSPNGTSSVGAAATKFPSVNKLNQSIKKGHVPDGLGRVDIPKNNAPNQQVHITFTGKHKGIGLNRDGSWKDLNGRQPPKLTSKQKEWLINSGWEID